MKSKIAADGNLLYGGDYNPEQWLDSPEILEKDVRMMRDAHINTVTMGVFSWSKLEPEEGKFDFGWLKERIDTLYQNGIHTILATPSGARPKWLADKYPEVLRVSDTGIRNHFGFRHNHCMSSPVYREKTALIDRKLSEAFGQHPGVIAWHINNEMGGACYCPLCQEKFRQWLRERYGTIDAVNQAWNTTFWSHVYNSFEEIEAPMAVGETMLHGLTLDWNRFTTWLHRDFTRHEKKAIRDGGSDRPVTMNLMYNFRGLDYSRFAEDMDFMSWDNYPTWHKVPETETAEDTAFEHDYIRSLKREPYLMMESCPSSTNWQSVSMLKRPGILMAQSLQAIAHGADGSLFFQIRQSRGASEKFHGAVIDHYGGEDTRVFRECAETGAALEKLHITAGAVTVSPVAILWDTGSRWAMEGSQGPRNMGLHHRECAEKIHQAVQSYGVNCDVLPASCEVHYGDPRKAPENYRVLICPMLYMTTAETEERIRKFAKAGGTVILTYWTGIADEHDLCYLGGTPHGLMDAAGLRSEEIDGIYDNMFNAGVPVAGNDLDLPADTAYRCDNLCELERLQDDAEPVLTYAFDFYEGSAAVTSHKFGRGRVFTVSADFEQAFWTDFIYAVLKKKKLQPILGNGRRYEIPEEGSDVIHDSAELPDGVQVTTRETEQTVYIFLQNFNTRNVRYTVPQHALMVLGERGTLAPFETAVLAVKKTERKA